MQWNDGRQSDNVDDVRGSSGGGIGGRADRPRDGIVDRPRSLPISSASTPSVVLNLLSGGGGGGADHASADASSSRPDRVRRQATWSAASSDPEVQLRESRPARYRRGLDPDLRRERRHLSQAAPRRSSAAAIPTACGQGEAAAAGPFYCPADEKVYIDLDFFHMLEQRFHAPGDFARAYVIAHEVGHHVQKLLGITAKTDAMRQRMSATQNTTRSRCASSCRPTASQASGAIASPRDRARSSSIRATSTKRSRQRTRSATTRSQKQSRGTVVPDSFTHGTSAQRVGWFKSRHGSRATSRPATRSARRRPRSSAARIAPAMRAECTHRVASHDRPRGAIPVRFAAGATRRRRTIAMRSRQDPCKSAPLTDRTARHRRFQGDDH